MGFKERAYQYLNYGFLLFTLIASHALIAESIPSLPYPVTNNAVASVTIDRKQYILSLMGLAAEKTYKDVHNQVWQLVIDEQGKFGQWEALPNVPSSHELKGRLASVAVGVKDYIYLFGGYTVAQDHSEISIPDVYQYSPTLRQYKKMASMPIPVDDTVALVYQDRYIYLVSGWHNDGNVNLTQVYDTHTNQWFQASPFLGNPVFGHAGAIADNRLLICDGVKVVAQPRKRRIFEAEPACYLGLISPTDNTRIDWQVVDHPTGLARYRMAAAGDATNKLGIFYGGATNPYNYNGIGYDGEPSEPSNQLWVFNFETQAWTITTLNNATMDHRGMVKLADQWIVLGGMGSKQTVLNQITPISQQSVTSAPN